MMCRGPTTLTFLTAFLVTTTAAADKKPADEATPIDQVVLINATPKLGGASTKNIKRFFTATGMLIDVPEPVEAILDGRVLQAQNIDQVKSAFLSSEYDKAQKLIEENEQRIFANVAAGDPLPALAELAQWKGLIAGVQDKPDEALAWFRVTMRFDPAWSLDRKFSTPSILKLAKKAKKEADETGKLKLDVEPQDAMMQIDGGKPQSVSEKVQLPAGQHLVVVMAEGRQTYADFVEVEANKVAKLPLSLQKESKTDKTQKAVNAAISTASGEERLAKTRPLSKIMNNAKLFVYVEDANGETVTLRVYNVGAKRVSKPFDVDINAPQTQLQSKIMAAIRPENLEPAAIGGGYSDKRNLKWYERWYVWVGAAAVLGGGILTYQYATREPDHLVIR